MDNFCYPINKNNAEIYSGVSAYKAAKVTSNRANYRHGQRYDYVMFEIYFSVDGVLRPRRLRIPLFHPNIFVRPPNSSAQSGQD